MTEGIKVVPGYEGTGCWNPVCLGIELAGAMLVSIASAAPAGPDRAYDYDAAGNLTEVRECVAGPCVGGPPPPGPASVPPCTPTNCLQASQRLSPGQSLTSLNGKYML